jgi:hypothetical protein
MAVTDNAGGKNKPHCDRLSKYSKCEITGHGIKGLILQSPQLKAQISEHTLSQARRVRKDSHA